MRHYVEQAILVAKSVAWPNIMDKTEAKTKAQAAALKNCPPQAFRSRSTHSGLMVKLKHSDYSTRYFDNEGGIKT